MTDENAPVTLCAFPQELYAQLLVDALSDHGITSEMSGGMTAGFRAEAPGMVKVLVNPSDLEAARAFFTEWEHEGRSIDWDSVDLGKFEDGDAPS